MKNAPGPTTLEALRQFFRSPIQMFSDAQIQYGDIVRFAAFGYELYQVTQPDLAQTVLNSPQFEMSDIVEHPFMGRGLATNTGESWMQQRRIMQPHFHQQAVAHLSQLMVEKTDALMANWHKVPPHDILNDLTRLNHLILGQSLLDVDFTEHSHFLDDLTTIRHYINRRFQALFPMPEQLPTPRNLAFKAAVKRFDSLIEKALANPSENSILARLVQAQDGKTGYQMNQKQVRDELNTMFFNGYEDAAVTVTWALYLLSQHPDYENLLHEELAQVVGKRPVELADLNQLTKLNLVIQETLRLYPPTWAVLRDVLEETSLGDYAIPKGASVQVTIYVLHRHPEYWERAESFYPERFNGTYPQAAYLPFGAGARQCIARPFALMQIKLVLATLLQQFRFDCEQQLVELDAMASLRPKKNLRFRLLAR